MPHAKREVWGCSLKKVLVASRSGGRGPELENIDFHDFDDLGHVHGPFGSENRLWACAAHNVLKIQMACRDGIL